MVVVGTSATVQPAASMPFIARDNGAVVIEINPEPTPLTTRISNLPLMGRQPQRPQCLPSFKRYGLALPLTRADSGLERVLAVAEWPYWF
jgi:hypothetical protein